MAWMEFSLWTLVWIVAVGLVVGLIVWLGPRPSQWRSHGKNEGEEPPED